MSATRSCHHALDGTNHLTKIMNDYDILPVHNFQYGAIRIEQDLLARVCQVLSLGIPDGCWYGCTLACAKCAEKFESYTGPHKGEQVTSTGQNTRRGRIGANSASGRPRCARSQLLL